MPFETGARLRATLTAVLLTAALPLAGVAQGGALTATYGGAADQLIKAALADSAAYKRLTLLVDRFGNRLSGSESLERTLDWVLEQMKGDGLQNVHAEPVMVPHWVRGDESAELVAPRPMALPMLGLGGSIATPAEGITADVLVVSSFDDLTANAARAKGRIVLYDAPFTSYGETVQYRTNGASAAAKLGAVAALVRSVTPSSQRTPHTGVMHYEEGVARIPTAAITVEDAMMLHRMQDRGERVVVKLKMSARTLPDAHSRNVMAEVTGREKPDEVVILSGHIDSWDVGQGAMDDGGGAVAAWEAVRLIQVLGLHPRRTIRAVLWTNEENGTRGGEGYRDAHQTELGKHVLAVESDDGVFRPTGFGFTGSDAAFAVMEQVGKVLERVGAGAITRGGGGADIGPMMALGVPGAGLQVDDVRYFWYHHTNADTIDKLDPREMAQCTAAMAILAYVVADMADALPREMAGR